jgi:hypothetical protein
MLNPFIVLVATVFGQSIPNSVVDKQQEVFQRLWAEDFEWRFAELPTKGKVAEHQNPYSGHIYPDRSRGTASILRKYDKAFNGGGLPATVHEQRDTSMTAPISRTYTGRGLFGGLLLGRARSRGVPHWYGHCNGWTAATIRHAEPQTSVMRNGVQFTPADIKGLLAEIYIYNEHIVLGGQQYRMNPGTFHAIIANWLGRGGHAVAMEADPGREKWNYPIYRFATSSAQRGRNQVDVRMTIVYAKYSDREHHKSPRIEGKKHFHYALNLDDTGAIVGGYWYRGSSSIDMLWIPLQPKASGRPGNERGNPHVSVDEVLAIWRDSVPEDVRAGWLIADPAPLDRVNKVRLVANISPVQVPVQEPTEIAETADDMVVAATYEEEADAGRSNPDLSD